jgi:hypothetical protein
MTKIRLPIPEEDLEISDKPTINYKEFIEAFMNNTLNELKENLNAYHTVKEIECRKNLVTFFKQKVADFELLYLLDLGTQYLPYVREINITNFYEDVANRLAFVFENLKNTISPSWNVNEALKNLHLSKIEEQEDKEYTFEKYYLRLIKIYLQKENIDYFKNITIENNVVILNEKYKVILCGDLANPKFSLIDPVINIKNFTISKLIKYIEIETLHSKLYNLHKKFKALKKRIEFKMEGGFKQFNVNIEDLNLKINKTFDFDKIEDFRDTLNKKFPCLSFSLDEGWFIIFRKGKILSNEILDSFDKKWKNIAINQSKDIDKFMKKVFDSENIINFKSPKLFSMFQEALKVEIYFFKAIQSSLSNYEIKRHKKVVWVQNVKFKFISLKDDLLEYDLYVDSYKVFIDKNKLIEFSNKTTVMYFETFLLLLRNMCISSISLFSDCIVDYDYNGDKLTGSSLHLYEDFIEYRVNNMKVLVYPDYCKVGNSIIKDIKKYITFIKNVYQHGKIVREYFSVEICGFVISYDPSYDKIVSNIKNEEIFEVKNIQHILVNLKIYYRYNLIPDLVTKSFVMFNLGNNIYKIHLSYNLLDQSDEMWFGELRKVQIENDGTSKLIQLTLSEFIDLYKSAKIF